MHTTEELQQILDTAIQNLKFPDHPKQLYDPITYIINLGGKRVRPLLVLMATELFGENANESIHAAMAIEIFHNFTLVHDDIMDNAPLRRGKATVHEKWSTNIAILSGDVMMVEANKSLAKVNPAFLGPVLNTFNATAQGVCEGQQLDMEFEGRDDVSIEEYINMIRLKTAVLLGGALKLGAIIAGASEKDADLIYQFGENIGIAFQLHDDILDVYADPEKFGKQVGGDIIANKKTFLLLKAFELAEGEIRTSLTTWTSYKEFNAQEKVDTVRQVYDTLDVQDIAKESMNYYRNKALAVFDQINVSDEKKANLLTLTEQLMAREY
ncbi:MULTISPECIES: polyprenyl synthetase family protein [unclassified Pedobacter]|uniref:polyprenyl synthetase family protein n=1 Tax=unclassified Pedobacter TaxID=2628915 RepID=UPI0014222906|nr:MULTISPECIES: polyprenyl synthetase family protein [unclassified Pedobacter]NII83336.1 geranylgeranyl diphosphate synthase type II [Pedobacter sp. SG908]NMN37202.1 geranylgeranyl diphosphate synthase type II [Pedobacter sp. SG918]